MSDTYEHNEDMTKEAKSAEEAYLDDDLPSFTPCDWCEEPILGDEPERHLACQAEITELDRAYGE